MRAQGIRQTCRQCEKQPSLKAEWNCEPKYVNGKPLVVSTIYRGSPLEMDLDRCYVHWITKEVGRVFELHDLWVRGVMPVHGGSLDQPQGLIEAFHWLDHCVAEAKEMT